MVVNYRTPDLTTEAVRSLEHTRLTRHRLEITIVDNGSDDGSSEALRCRLPAYELLQTSRNLGFAGGNNVALREILSRLPEDIDPDDSFILLVNSDVIVEPESLETCLRYAACHPDVGIIGPRVLLPDGRLDLACRRSFPTPSSGFWKLTGLARRYPNSRRLARYNLTYLDEHETAEVDSVMGAFMLLRLRAVLQAGILDERFFFYGEDLDWAFRIKAHGWKVMYHPRAVVHHLKGGTTRRHASRMIVEFYRSMWLFYRKHYAEHRIFLIDWAVLAGILTRGLVALGMNALRPADRKRVS